MSPTSPSTPPMPPSSAKEPPVPDWQRDAPFPDVGYTYAPESAWRVSQDSQLAIHAVYADIPIHQPQQYAAYPQFAPYSIAVAEGQQAVQAPPADPSRVAPSPNYSPPPQPPLPTYRSDVPYHDDGRAPPSNYPPFITIPPSVPDSGEKGKHREAESSAQPKIDYDKMVQSYQTIIATVSSQTLLEQLTEHQSHEMVDRMLSTAIGGLHALRPEAAESLNWQPHRPSLTPGPEGGSPDRQKDPDEDHPKKRQKREKAQHECTICSATVTPEWRRGPLGPRTLCNACGLVWAKILKQRSKEASSVHSTNAASRTGHPHANSRNSRAPSARTGIGSGSAREGTHISEMSPESAMIELREKIAS